MELDKTVQLSMLLDTYGVMLTQKKQEMLSMYVNENMSYQEIANLLNISKPAVLDSIKVAENKLLEYESKLKILDFRQKLKDVAQNSNNIRQDLLSLLKEN